MTAVFLGEVSRSQEVGRNCCGGVSLVSVCGVTDNCGVGGVNVWKKKKAKGSKGGGNR